MNGFLRPFFAKFILFIRSGNWIEQKDISLLKDFVATAAGVSMTILSGFAASAQDETGGRFMHQVDGASRAVASAHGVSMSDVTSSIPSPRAALGYDAAKRGAMRDLIASHAAANGVPFALADAVVRIESRYNPRVSNGGALGLMQIKPATARGVGFSGSASELYDADTNLRYGMRYLAQAYRMSGGDTCQTVMRYQSGHYATRLNGANRAYCGKARAIMAKA